MTASIADLEQAYQKAHERMERYPGLIPAIDGVQKAWADLTTAKDEIGMCHEIGCRTIGACGEHDPYA